MGIACKECLGRSWIVIDDAPTACPACLKRMKTPAAKKTFEAAAMRAFEIQQLIAEGRLTYDGRELREPVSNDTYGYIDGPAPANAPRNDQAMGPVEAGVATQEQVDRQNEADLRAALASGIGRGK